MYATDVLCVAMYARMKVRAVCVGRAVHAVHIPHEAPPSWLARNTISFQPWSSQENLRPSQNNSKVPLVSCRWMCNTTIACGKLGEEESIGVGVAGGGDGS